MCQNLATCLRVATLRLMTAAPKYRGAAADLQRGDFVAEALDNKWTHTWRWRKILGERHGYYCHVVARGKLNSVCVVFEDGYKVVTSRYAILRRK
jgi:hypothetical protein